MFGWKRVMVHNGPSIVGRGKVYLFTIVESRSDRKVRAIQFNLYAAGMCVCLEPCSYMLRALCGFGYVVMPFKVESIDVQLIFTFIPAGCWFFNFPLRLIENRE